MEHDSDRADVKGSRLGYRRQLLGDRGRTQAGNRVGRFFAHQGLNVRDQLVDGHPFVRRGQILEHENVLTTVGLLESGVELGAEQHEFHPCHHVHVRGGRHLVSPISVENRFDPFNRGTIPPHMSCAMRFQRNSAEKAAGDGAPSRHSGPEQI